MALAAAAGPPAAVPRRRSIAGLRSRAACPDASSACRMPAASSGCSTWPTTRLQRRRWPPTCARCRSPGRTLAVCGMLGDKDVPGVVGALRESIDQWFAATSEGPRAIDAAELGAQGRRRRASHLQPAGTVPAGDATRRRGCARPGDRIVVFGSFHTVGPALAALAFPYNPRAMEEPLKARLIGASILVLLAVVLVPELLSGPKIRGRRRGGGRARRTRAPSRSTSAVRWQPAPGSTPRPDTAPAPRHGAMPTVEPTPRRLRLRLTPATAAPSRRRRRGDRRPAAEAPAAPPAPEPAPEATAAGDRSRAAPAQSRRPRAGSRCRSARSVPRRRPASWSPTSRPTACRRTSRRWPSPARHCIASGSGPVADRAAADKLAARLKARGLPVVRRHRRLTRPLC